MRLWETACIAQSVTDSKSTPNASHPSQTHSTTIQEQKRKSAQGSTRKREEWTPDGAGTFTALQKWKRDGTTLVTAQEVLGEGPPFRPVAFSWRHGVLVPCRGCDKLPQTLRLKTPPIYYFTALELRSLNWDLMELKSKAMFLLGLWGKTLFPGLCEPPEAVHVPGLAATALPMLALSSLLS